MEIQKMHFGIDYGSKLAGTTVITYNRNGELYQRSSKKKEDADQVIIDAVEELKPSSIYIDAPLSLPAAYFDKGKDYFYRRADKELKAMSPMFLGGLTARAMKLKASITSQDIAIHEVYPGALVRSMPALNEHYDKKNHSNLETLTKIIESLLGDIHIAASVTNLHQIDSILAWYSGFRHQKGMAVEVGHRDEGVIIY